MRSLGRLVRCQRSLCRVQRPHLEPQDQQEKTDHFLWLQFPTELPSSPSQT